MSGLLAKLSQETALSEYALVRLMRTAPVRYKTFQIPKRTGGLRTVSQPAREVKRLQRALCTVLLQDLPVHDAAMAYRNSRSIADNARVHQGITQIVKLDFEDFFPSIRSIDWVAYCKAHLTCLDVDEIELTSTLLFKKMGEVRGLRLAIGAPSSPMLSNILMYEFDRLVFEKASAEGINYTRYADDLTFSALRTGYLTRVHGIVRAAMSAIEYPRLKINSDKTVFATTKYKRQVTGVMLTNQGGISIGKEKKRLIHAAVNRAKQGRLTKKQLQWLCGYLAFVNVVEPGFLDTLRRKYGPQVVGGLQSYVVREKLQDVPQWDLI